MSAQTLRYNVFDPSSCAFPQPRVPVLPVLTRGALGRSTTGRYQLVGAGRQQRSYTRGRYALFDAYRLCGVGPQGALLAPSYHCRTMIDPAISLGARVMLYAVTEQLAPDLAALQRLLRTAAMPVRALLLTHYFGFAQASAALKDFCDEHGIAVVEDCSHLLFNRRGDEQIGMLGRYVTTSPYKLLPCEEGGVLIASAETVMPERASGGLRAEVQTLVDAVENAWRHRRQTHRDDDLARLDADLERICASPIDRGTQLSADQTGASRLYVPAEQHREASRASHWLLRLCDIDRAADRRRANYMRWVESVRGLPNCRALYERLPDDCVPYMFPLLLDHSQTHFFVLKRLGVPIWRWDDMADSQCPVAQHYREHLLHLPCHQALSDHEMSWMTNAVAKVMRRLPVHSAVPAS